MPSTAEEPREQLKEFPITSTSSLRTMGLVLYKLPWLGWRHIDPLADLSVLKWVVLNSVRIEDGFVFLLEYKQPNALLLFAKVYKVFKQHGKAKFIGKLMPALEFVRSLYSFRVEEVQELIQSDLNNLKHYRRVVFASFRGVSLVVKSFYTPDRFSKSYDFDSQE